MLVEMVKHQGDGGHNDGDVDDPDMLKCIVWIAVATSADHGRHHARQNDDDFEKRLRYISKEETTILDRMKKRSTRWRKSARNLIVFFVLPKLKVFTIRYAMMLMRTVMLEWKMRSLRVMRIFISVVLAWILYSRIHSLIGMCKFPT
ncbi:putative Lunapark family protein [Helianthus anomalus]